MWFINLLKAFAWSFRVIPDRQNPDQPYLTRWYLLGGPKHRFFTACLHQFHTSDPMDPHDHPFAYLSIVLKGGYWEHRPGKERKWRGFGHIGIHRAKYQHRVELEPGKTAYTLFLMGPRTRDWFFYRHSKAVQHEVYLRALQLRAKREAILQKAKELKCLSSSTSRPMGS